MSRSVTAKLGGGNQVRTEVTSGAGADRPWEAGPVAELDGGTSTNPTLVPPRVLYCVCECFLRREGQTPALVSAQMLPVEAGPSLGSAGRGLWVTFLGSLASVLVACTGLFPSEAGVRDGGCRAPRLAPPQPGGASESCGIREEPCAKQRRGRLTWGTAHRSSQRPGYGEGVGQVGQPWLPGWGRGPTAGEPVRT